MVRMPRRRQAGEEALAAPALWQELLGEAAGGGGTRLPAPWLGGLPRPLEPVGPRGNSWFREHEHHLRLLGGPSLRGHAMTQQGEAGLRHAGLWGGGRRTPVVAGPFRYFPFTSRIGIEVLLTTLDSTVC